MNNNSTIYQLLSVITKLLDKKIYDKKKISEAYDILTEVESNLRSTQPQSGGYIPTPRYTLADGSVFDITKNLPIVAADGSNVDYGKFHEIYTYYVGILSKKYKKSDLVRDIDSYLEVTKGISGIETRFPMIIQLLSMRNNWKLLTTKEAKNITDINYSATNDLQIVSKTIFSERITIQGEDRLSNKGNFYEEFYENSPDNFISDFIKFDINDRLLADPADARWNKFTGKVVILKPSEGFAGIGIQLFKNFNPKSSSISSNYHYF